MTASNLLVMTAQVPLRIMVKSQKQFKKLLELNEVIAITSHGKVLYWVTKEEPVSQKPLVIMTEDLHFTPDEQL
jgi:hypothetical protein